MERLRHTVEEVSVFEREVDERVKKAIALRFGGEVKEEGEEAGK